MKKTNKKYIFVLLVIVSILLCFVGCSDMMEKLGKISLHIELDNHEVSVASYTLTGTQGSISLNPEVPSTLNVDLSSLKPGKWTLAVKAFDSESKQIGTGTQVVELKEGQVLDTTLLVVFTQPEPKATDFTLSSPSRFDTTDGKIKDTTAKMEYKLASSGDEAYVACTEGETVLPPGTYLVRFAAAHGFDASEPLEIIVPEYVPIQLTIEDPLLTTTKVYDGTVDIEGIVTEGALIGIQGTDAVTVSATASYDSATAENGKNITVTYTLSGADKDNYKKPVDKTVSGVIEKKQLTVSGTAITSSKVYDGSTTANVSVAGALGGILTSDSVLLSDVTASYDSADVGENKSLTVMYALNGEDASNYIVLNDTSKTATITKKQLTVTAAADGKVYDGTTDSTGSLSLAGIVGSDDVSASGTFVFADANAGTSKTANVTGITLSGAKASNYSVSATTTTTATITKKQLTVTATADGKVYDGTADATGSLSLAGIVGSDDVSASGTFAFADTNAGTSKTVDVTGITLSGAKASNYSVSATTTATATITKAVLTATVGDFSRSYGEENPSLAVSVTGFKNDESPSTASGYVSPTASVAATTSTGVGSYGITLAGGSADNYSFDTSDTGTLTIQQKELSIFTMLYGKVYDGTTSASGSLSLIGVFNSEDVGVTGTFAFADANAGNIKTVNVTGITLTGTQKANYTLSQTTKSGIVSITQKPLTVTATADGKVYDGTADATGSLSLAGIVGSDDVSASGTFAFADTNAGTSKTVDVTGITLSGAKASNYSVSATTTATATITKATMTGSLSITGTAKYGETMVAVASLTNAGTPTYQWKRGGVAINGSNGTTYTLTVSDIGYTITVTATAGGSNYQGSITSSATALVGKNDGGSISDSPVGYFPSLPATQTIINFTGFTENLAGIEARVALNGSTYGSYADIEVDSRGRAMILVGSNVTTAAKVQFRKKETSTTYAGPIKEISLSEQALSVGDYYQGGVVAYLYTSGFGYVSGEVHGIIAAKNNQGAIRWYNGTNDLVGVSNTSIGAGFDNTNAIIAKQGEVSTSYAAGLARSYTGGGYADWFLPSLGELTVLYNNSALIGNLNLDGSNYWSSNETIQYGWSPAIYATGRLFSATIYSMDNIYAFWKTDILLVRPIRYF